MTLPQTGLASSVIASWLGYDQPSSTRDGRVEADVPYPQCRRHRSAGYTGTGRGTRGTPSPEVLLCRVGVLSSFGQDILDSLAHD
jgi:hypothetical protein